MTEDQIKECTKKFQQNITDLESAVADGKLVSGMEIAIVEAVLNCMAAIANGEKWKISYDTSKAPAEEFHIEDKTSTSDSDFERLFIGFTGAFIPRTPSPSGDSITFTGDGRGTLSKSTKPRTPRKGTRKGKISAHTANSSKE